MNRHQTDSANQLLNARAGFLDLIAVAVVGALGIDVLASALMEPPSRVVYALSIVAAVLIIFSIVFLGFRVHSQLNNTLTIEGVLPVDSNTNAIIGIYRYNFSEETAKNAKAAFAENAAFERAWMNPKKEKNGIVDREAHTRFVIELLEYYVLKSLSLHLSTYFNDIGDGDEVSSIRREHIPDVLLQNRVLSHLSTPMEDRASFTTKADKETRYSIVSPQGEVVYAIKGTGEIFDLFRLKLPKRSKIYKKSESSTSIETTRFNITFEYGFDQTRTNFPRGFEVLYLGQKQETCIPLNAWVTVSVRFNPLALLSGTGWHYFRWVDTFVDRLHRSLSFAAYTEKIGWESALTQQVIRRHSEQPKPAGVAGKVALGDKVQKAAPAPRPRTKKTQ